MLKTDRLQVVFAHHDEPIPETFLEYAKPQVSSDRPLNERQIQKWKSRRMAHFLLTRMFEWNGLDPELISTMQKTASGRPYIPNSTMDFNLSHSGEWVAVILSQSAEKKAVGIDIEHPQKERRYDALLRHYAPPTEVAEILDSKALPQLKGIAPRFYLSWCLREAVLKSQGAGLVKLSSVQHVLSQQKIDCAYCPQGKLFFHDKLPFYLAYFIEQPSHLLLQPNLFEWKNGQFCAVTDEQPIIYQVN